MALSSLSTPVLVIQLVTLALLGFGVYQMKFKRNLRAHAATQAAGTLLNLATVLLVMMPSLLRAAPPSAQAIDWMYGLVLFHHTLGLVALAATLVLAGGWLVSGLKPNGCPGKPKNKRKIMRATYALWLSSIAVGIAVYAAYL